MDIKTTAKFFIKLLFSDRIRNAVRGDGATILVRHRLRSPMRNEKVQIAKEPYGKAKNLHKNSDTAAKKKYRLNF